MTDAPRSTLYLLRHAHSSWAQPGQRDHQRPLDERGRDDALALGPEIIRAGYVIDTVVCSTAARAQETFAAVRPHLAADVRVESSDDLYALGIEAYLAAAHAHGESRGLMLVGHNPMIEGFALQLAGSSDRPARQTLAAGFPTAGLAVLEFATGLAEIAAGTGHLTRLLHPRDHGD
jgi:phosphohistidine phosphatase